jgi:hypothetical protein
LTIEKDLFELEKLSLSVHLVNIRKTATLCLEGTVLLYYHRQPKVDVHMQIPVELISVFEGRRFRGRRLITILLMPFILVALGLISLLFDEDSVARLLGVITVIGVFVWLLLLPVLLFIFCKKTRAVSLHIAPANNKIEIWVEKRQVSEVDHFIKELRRRQSLVENALVSPINRSIGYVDVHSAIPAFLAFLFLSCLPALMLEKPYLFVLTVIPVVWFGYKRIKFQQMPKQYKRAIRSSLRHDWENALAYLNDLRFQFPEYVPGLLLLSEVYTRCSDFDKALEVTNKLSEIDIELARSRQSDIVLLKNLNKRRTMFET